MGRCRCTMEPTPRTCRVHNLDIKREAVNPIAFFQAPSNLTYLANAGLFGIFACRASRRYSTLFTRIIVQ
jgi:hypothetical protein